MPAAQLPGFAYTRRVVAFAQVFAGGMLHVTPAHGSGLHAPPEQPNWHVVSVGAYEQAPPEQVPVEAYVRRVVELRHDAAGGVLQTVSVKP